MSGKVIGGDNSAKIRAFIENAPDNEEVLEALRLHEEWVEGVYIELRERRVRCYLLENRRSVAAAALTDLTVEYDHKGNPKQAYSYEKELLKEAEEAGK